MNHECFPSLQKRARTLKIFYISPTPFPSSSSSPLYTDPITKTNWSCKYRCNSAFSSHRPSSQRRNPSPPRPSKPSGDLNFPRRRRRRQKRKKISRDKIKGNVAQSSGSRRGEQKRRKRQRVRRRRLSQEVKIIPRKWIGEEQMEMEAEDGASSLRSAGERSGLRFGFVGKAA